MIKIKSTFYPFSVVSHEKKVVFVYGLKNLIETKLFLSQSDDGLSFKNKYEIQLLLESGKRKRLVDCDALCFFAYGKQAYLAFEQIVKGKRQILIAQSDDMLNFIVKKQATDLAGMYPIVSNHKYKKNFLAYYGDKSIRVAASDNLTDWHTTSALLPTRTDFFDDDALLHVIGSVIVDRGILVLYDARSDQKNSRKIKIGCAMFSFDKPYAPIWRSQVPIWEETAEKRKHKVRFLGCAIVAESLHIYWSSLENEFFVKTINLASSGLIAAKKTRLLKRHLSNPILKPLAANKWEQDATFNPAAVYLEDKIHLLYRAIGENGVSVLGYAASADGILVNERLNYPVFSLAQNLKIFKNKPAIASPYVSGGSWAGCEDPRATVIGKRIYVTYVFFDGCNPPGVALTSIRVADFLNKNWNWKRPKLISKVGEIQKNWMIFPEKINGKYAILHSITPKISIEYVDSLDCEGITIESMKKAGVDEHRWDNIVRGAGAPPLLTKYGWLVLYHAMDKRDPNKYKVGAMILDYSDPTKILHRCNYPILEPTAHYENHGAKAGVVYVCGAVIKENTLFVYYGGADSVVCVATENVDEFLKELTQSVPHVSAKPALLEIINN
ncbi:MAG: hypothetical protein WCF93_02225 [Candidatus Moraniibacteriota bacterium]